VEELRVVLAHHRQLRKLLLHQLIQPLLLTPSSHTLGTAAPDKIHMGGQSNLKNLLPLYECN
jgi:hypothetical protein